MQNQVRVLNKRNIWTIVTAAKMAVEIAPAATEGL